jgi:hypothetical protein
VALDALPPAWRRTAFDDALRGRPARFPSGRLLLPPYGLLWLRPRDDESGSAASTTTIELEVRTEWGEQVYLCGPTAPFGGGDPARALGPLSAEAHPTWRTEVDVPAGAYVEFWWVKKRDGRVVERAPRRYAQRAGTSETWRLEGTQ